MGSCNPISHLPLLSGGHVAIVGAGHVGSTTAYTLMLQAPVNRITIIDAVHAKAEGEGLDLAHCAQFAPTVTIEAGDSYELVAGASIIIITAGTAQLPGESRIKLLGRNYELFQKMIPELVRINKSALFIFLTQKITGLSVCRVFGSGTVLDTARLRYEMGNHFSISPKDITAYVLGEHGDRSFIWWSRAMIGGSQFSEFCSNDKESSRLKAFFLEKVRSAAGTIIAKKGYTNFAIAEVIVKIVRAILLGQSRIFTVSTCFDDCALSIPMVIRSNGLCQQLPLILDKEEQAALARAKDEMARLLATFF